MTGAVDMYDACVKRHMYKGKFEFTYVSKSAVIVKTLKTGMRIVLKSVYGYEIEKINIYHDRYDSHRYTMAPASLTLPVSKNVSHGAIRPAYPAGTSSTLCSHF